VLPIIILLFIVLIGRRIEIFLGRDSGVVWHSHSVRHAWEKLKAVRRAPRETLWHAIAAFVDSIFIVGWWEQSIYQEEIEDKAEQVMCPSSQAPLHQSYRFCKSNAVPTPKLTLQAPLHQSFRFCKSNSVPTPKLTLSLIPSSTGRPTSHGHRRASQGLPTSFPQKQDRSG
jgi:hypothetical protein